MEATEDSYSFVKILSKLMKAMPFASIKATNKLNKIHSVRNFANFDLSISYDSKLSSNKTMSFLY